MRTFKDIKKGDTVRWEMYGMLTGIQAEIFQGKAVKFVKGNKEYVDEWMAKPEQGGTLLPVTPLRFKGIVTRRTLGRVRRDSVR